MLKGRDEKAARPNLTVFAFLCVEDDPQRLRTTVGPALDGHAAWLGRSPEDVFAAAGPAPTAATRVRELWAAGADTVVLRAVGPEPFRQIEAAVRELRG